MHKLHAVDGRTEFKIDYETNITIRAAYAKEGNVVKRVTKGLHVLVSNEAKFLENLKRENGIETPKIDGEGESSNSKGWGKKRANTVFVDHGDSVYLECVVIGRPDETYFTLNGERVTNDEIAHMLRKSVPRINPVVDYRRIKIENITAVEYA